MCVAVDNRVPCVNYPGTKTLSWKQMWHAEETCSEELALCTCSFHGNCWSLKFQTDYSAENNLASLKLLIWLYKFKIIQSKSLSVSQNVTSLQSFCGLYGHATLKIIVNVSNKTQRAEFNHLKKLYSINCKSGIDQPIRSFSTHSEKSHLALSMNDYWQ